MASSGYDGDGSCENLTLGRPKLGTQDVQPQTEAERRSKKLDLIQIKDIPGIHHAIYTHNLRQVKGCSSPLVLSPKCATKVNHTVTPPAYTHASFELPPGEEDSEVPGHCVLAPVDQKSPRVGNEVPDREQMSCVNWKCLCSRSKQPQATESRGTNCNGNVKSLANGTPKNSDGLPGLVHPLNAHMRPSRNHTAIHSPSAAYHSIEQSQAHGIMLPSPQHLNYFQFEYAYPSPDPSHQTLEDWCEHGQMMPQSSSMDGSAAILGKCILKFGRKAPACIRDPGSFSDPTCLDAFPNGDVAVMDSDNYTLQLFTQTGHCKKVYQFRRKIVDVVVLDHSSVALLRENDLGVFNIQEHAARDIKLPDCTTPVAMAKIQHSRYHLNYVVAMPTYVNIYKGNGEIFKKIPSHCTEKGSSRLKYHLVRITDISVHKRTKEIYILDSGSRNVYIFSSKGSYKSTIDTTQFAVGAMSGYGRLSVDSTGNLVLADSKNHRLLHYSSEGGATCMMVYRRDYMPTGVLAMGNNKLAVTINSSGRSFAGVRMYNYKH